MGLYAGPREGSPPAPGLRRGTPLPEPPEALGARVERGPQRIHADCPLTLATAVAGRSCGAARRWKPAGLPELSYLEPPVRRRRAK